MTTERKARSIPQFARAANCGEVGVCGMIVVIDDGEYPSHLKIIFSCYFSTHGWRYGN
jgi:hypothetical protein